MSLNPARLRSALSPLFRDSMPSQAVDSWARAYASYAQDALAGGTVPTPLVPQPVSGEFIRALDVTLRNMWMAAAWAGPGLVGTTLLVPDIGPFLLANAAILNRSFDPDAALSLIAEAVHRYTLSITVTVVPASGTPTIVPLT